MDEQQGEILKRALDEMGLDVDDCLHFHLHITELKFTTREIVTAQGTTIENTLDTEEPFMLGRFTSNQEALAARREEAIARSVVLASGMFKRSHAPASRANAREETYYETCTLLQPQL